MSTPLCRSIDQSSKTEVFVYWNCPGYRVWTCRTIPVFIQPDLVFSMAPDSSLCQPNPNACASLQKIHSNVLFSTLYSLWNYQFKLLYLLKTVWGVSHFIYRSIFDTRYLSVDSSKFRSRHSFVLQKASIIENTKDLLFIQYNDRSDECAFVLHVWTAVFSSSSLFCFVFFRKKSELF